MMTRILLRFTFVFAFFAITTNHSTFAQKGKSKTSSLSAQKKASDTAPSRDGNETAEKEQEDFTLEIDAEAKPTIELNPGKIEDQEKKKKEKKRKKNVFYGIKTKKRFIKSKQGRNTVIEIFYVLREYESPNKYPGEKFYYQHKKRQIFKTGYVSAKYGMPLHGTYKKMINDQVVLSGIFYKGVKHGRWEQYGSGNTLIDKKKFYEGFPKEADITYYDSEMKKVKEVVPIHHGKREGLYLRYYESGRVAEKGMYRKGHKVGRWNTYYDRWKKPRKEEIQYRRKPFDEDFEPYTVRAWDENGKQTISNIKRKRDW